MLLAACPGTALRASLCRLLAAGELAAAAALCEEAGKEATWRRPQLAPPFTFGQGTAVATMLFGVKPCRTCKGVAAGLGQPANR